ncbi:hypothetical protein BASA81_001537 [Batrachochytrium salamandrivorans]|nr:hypothetical protein BASA81_001537 [Batrachochytrium salamandrivorans]
MPPHLSQQTAVAPHPSSLCVLAVKPSLNKEALLPRSRLGQVSYRAKGSNVQISANICSLRSKQLQRRDTGEFYYSVAEFIRAVDSEFGPAAAVQHLETATVEPALVLKCGTALDHSDEWL